MPKVTRGVIDIPSIDVAEPLRITGDFVDFCIGELAGAVGELDKLKNEDSRKHLQRLVFLDLVNKFDVTIDKLLLWSSTKNYSIREKLLKELATEPATQKDLFQLLYLKEGAIEFMDARMESLGRNKLLRDRHSGKVRELMESVDWEGPDSYKVTAKTGAISKASIVRDESIPNTIEGYSDWLYSKRNSLTHGKGNQFTDADFSYLKSHFHASKIIPSFRLRLASIRVASSFYANFLDQYLDYLKSAAAKRIQT